jgi:hypothetical protein
MKTDSYTQNSQQMIDLTSNRISAAMSAEEFAATKTELQKVAQNLSFLVKLTQNETDAMYNMSDADKTFVRNCVAEMNGATDILPPYLKSEEINKDLTCGDQLLELENTLTELLTNVRRNRMLANYEAYTGASVFYHLVSAAARSGSGSAKAMHERLKSYHVNKKKGGRSAQPVAKTGDTRSN